MNGFVEKWPVRKVTGPVKEAGMGLIKEMKEGREGGGGQGMRMSNEVCANDPPIEYTGLTIVEVTDYLT